MQNTEIDITITLNVDPDYRYIVSATDVLALQYIEDTFVARITFSSTKEMINVANAMLKLAKVKDDFDNI